jgi:hypothetical protein
VNSTRTKALEVLELEMDKHGIHYRKIGPKRRIHFRVRRNGKELNISVLGGDGEFLKVCRFHEHLKPIMIFVWHVFEAPEIYILPFLTLKKVFGTRPFETKSWKDDGYYSWTSATGVPDQRKAMLKRFKDNWTLLKE